MAELAEHPGSRANRSRQWWDFPIYSVLGITYDGNILATGSEQLEV